MQTSALEHAVVAVGLIMVACLHNSYFVQLKPRFQIQVTQRKKTTPKMGKKRRPGPIKSITLYISEGEAGNIHSTKNAYKTM